MEDVEVGKHPFSFKKFEISYLNIIEDSTSTDIRITFFSVLLLMFCKVLKLY